MNETHVITDIFDSNGFLADPTLWNRDLALGIARHLGLDALEEPHWEVIDYLREHYLQNSTQPWGVNLCCDLELVNKQVYRLFGKPIEAWKVAGLPDPGEEARAYLSILEETGG